MKKPEHVLKAFIRFALAQGAVVYGMELMKALFSIIQGIVTTILANGTPATYRGSGLNCTIRRSRIIPVCTGPWWWAARSTGIPLT